MHLVQDFGADGIVVCWCGETFQAVPFSAPPFTEEVPEADCTLCLSCGPDCNPGD